MESVRKTDDFAWLLRRVELNAKAGAYRTAAAAAHQGMRAARRAGCSQMWDFFRRRRLSCMENYGAFMGSRMRVRDEETFD